MCSHNIILAVFCPCIGFLDFSKKGLGKLFYCFHPYENIDAYFFPKLTLMITLNEIKREWLVSVSYILINHGIINKVLKK